MGVQMLRELEKGTEKSVKGVSEIDRSVLLGSTLLLTVITIYETIFLMFWYHPTFRHSFALLLAIYSSINYFNHVLVIRTLTAPKLHLSDHSRRSFRFIFSTLLLLLYCVYGILINYKAVIMLSSWCMYNAISVNS